MAFLVAIGGHTGTGKTTLAYGLKKNAFALKDAIIAEDDEIRRELLGDDLKRTFKEEDYAPEVSDRVVKEINRRTIDALISGVSVINSSGFFSESSRQAIEQLAKDNHAEFVGIWLIAPDNVMRSRINKRIHERGALEKLSLEEGHASDADENVIDKFGDIGSPKSLAWKIFDASLPKEAVLHSVLTQFDNTSRS